MTRTDIRKHLKRLAAFRDAIMFADWVHRRRELLDTLDREAVILRELWETLPDDAEKRLKASIRRLRRETDGCFLFPMR